MCNFLLKLIPTIFTGLYSLFRKWFFLLLSITCNDFLNITSLDVDSVDEATKHLGISPSVFSAMIGGSFADQKICKDCPHRYSREEPFTTVSVDIRNNQTLKDSFEQYVKGDLLEGDNAYLCEKCGKKVRITSVA